MLFPRFGAALARLYIVSCVALAATSPMLRAQNAPSSPDANSLAELQAEVAALKAALSQKDAELARLKGAAAPAPAPSAPAEAPSAGPVPSASASSSAQVAPIAGEEGSPVQMSEFEVTTTQGHGYVSGNSASAFKTDESLMALPQGDIVVTSDLIRDLDYINTTDVLQYFGVQAAAQGEFMTLRGNSTVSLPYLDEGPEIPTWEDDAIIDSYEVIKGPAQTLYLNAGLSGVILKATKKPLPYNQEILTASIDDNGLYRLTGDFTGPIGVLGGAQFSYRFVGVYQHGNTYFMNLPNNREVLFPELGIKYRNTTVRVYYNLQIIKGEQDGQDIMTPNGDLYTGAGVHEANQPPNNLNEFETRHVYAELDQKLSNNWEMKLSGAYWNYLDFGNFAYATDVNWNNNTENFISRIDNEKWHFWTVINDYQGHYDIGPSTWEMPARDAFGWAFSSQVDKQAYWTTAPFPYPNGPIGGSVNVPVNSAAAINALQNPPVSAFSPPSVADGGPGGDFETELSTMYAQHTMDLIPNWLTVVAGFTFNSIATESVTDWAVLPWNATFESVSQWNHRLAAVIHLGPSVSIYALDSTTFTPPATGLFLENGELPPNQLGTGTELGLKWNFLGGKISGESAWFKEVLTNGLNSTAGTLPNGALYAAVIGSVTLEGVDGDASFTIVPGWQLIGSWYAGHQVDPFNQPVPGSYNNFWAAYTRYDFPKNEPLAGITTGGGVSRLGGRWQSTGGLTYSGYLPAIEKVEVGTLVNGFVQYQFNKHWDFRVVCDNILDQHYPVAVETAFIIDPSPGRIFSFETAYKY